MVNLLTIYPSGANCFLHRHIFEEINFAFVRFYCQSFLVRQNCAFGSSVSACVCCTSCFGIQCCTQLCRCIQIIRKRNHSAAAQIDVLCFVVCGVSRNNGCTGNIQCTNIVNTGSNCIFDFFVLCICFLCATCCVISDFAAIQVQCTAVNLNTATFDGIVLRFFQKFRFIARNNPVIQRHCTIDAHAAAFQPRIINNFAAIHFHFTVNKCATALCQCGVSFDNTTIHHKFTCSFCLVIQHINTTAAAMIRTKCPIIGNFATIHGKRTTTIDVNAAAVPCVIPCNAATFQNHFCVGIYKNTTTIMLYIINPRTSIVLKTACNFTAVATVQNSQLTVNTNYTALSIAR